MCRCKIIIVLDDSGAQSDLKITHNGKIPHYRDFLYKGTNKHHNNRADL